MTQQRLTPSQQYAFAVFQTLVAYNPKALINSIKGLYYTAGDHMNLQIHESPCIRIQGTGTLGVYEISVARPGSDILGDTHVKVLEPPMDPVRVGVREDGINQYTCLVMGANTKLPGPVDPTKYNGFMAAKPELTKAPPAPVVESVADEITEYAEPGTMESESAKPAAIEKIDISELAAKLLTQICETDNAAAQRLFMHSVPCNDALAEIDIFKYGYNADNAPYTTVLQLVKYLVNALAVANGESRYRLNVHFDSGRLAKFTASYDDSTFPPAVTKSYADEQTGLIKKAIDEQLASGGPVAAPAYPDTERSVDNGQ